MTRQTLLKFLFRRSRFVLLFAAFALMALRPGPDGNEYQVKAMFVFNFTKYVEWPDADQAGAFTIGVVGESEITEPLEKIAAQKKVGDRKIVVKKITTEDEEYCNIIIVSRAKLGKLEAIEKKQAGRGVLIISDESSRSAAINLITRDNKIRFEINQSLAKSGGVKISSQLLSLAVSIH